MYNFHEADLLEENLAVSTDKDEENEDLDEGEEDVEDDESLDAGLDE